MNVLSELIHPILIMEEYKYVFIAFSDISDDKREKVFEQFNDKFNNHITECNSIEKPTQEELFSENLYYGVFCNDNVLGFVNLIDEGVINNIRVIQVSTMCSFGKQIAEKTYSHIIRICKEQNSGISIGQFIWNSIIEMFTDFTTRESTIIIVSNVLKESLNFWNKVAKPFTIEDCKFKNKLIGQIIKKIEPYYKCDNNFHQVNGKYYNSFYYLFL